MKYDFSNVSALPKPDELLISIWGHIRPHLYIHPKDVYDFYQGGHEEYIAEEIINHQRKTRFGGNVVLSKTQEWAFASRIMDTLVILKKMHEEEFLGMIRQQQDRGQNICPVKGYPAHAKILNGYMDEVASHVTDDFLKVCNVCNGPENETDWADLYLEPTNIVISDDYRKLCGNIGDIMDIGPNEVVDFIKYDDIAADIFEDIKSEMPALSENTEQAFRKYYDSVINKVRDDFRTRTHRVSGQLLTDINKSMSKAARDISYAADGLSLPKIENPVLRLD